MSESDLQRVEMLFQTAADLPAAERGTFLTNACGGDVGLLAHVEALLGRLDDDALTLPPLPPLPEAAASPITEGPGTIIGRYKLLQVIGEGGFGVVYMAEQQEPVVRRVALKIIKLGMDTREVVARFEAERQALALMDHPNIARVLDGGATASGRPYFVMELVRGVAITDYCDQNDLGPHERLELFERVCHAVQHAHQKGVIHRDLKPSNVLVTMHDDHPIPKVIDFGVAKAMHTRLTEKTLFTQFQQFIGTPAYMSPEQAQMSALDVDTRTDIYALGVLLYELLTGSTPFDSKSLLDAGLVEVQRIIREDHPPRPSLRISTTGDAAVARQRGMDVHGLSRRLRGDLDWIVMKAMEKERGRRYATASALADDIRRHLHDEPVTAGPPGTAYRVRKFLARNRAAVVMVGVVLLALVGAVIGIGLGKIEADRNARLAHTKADHALEALDFLVSTLSLANPEVSLSPNVTVQTLLDDTSGRVATAFAEQPWAEARVRSAIGRAYAALGQHDRAEPHLRRTVELVDTLRAQADPLEDNAGFDAGDHYATLWALTNVAFNLDRTDAFAVAMRAREVGLDHVASAYPAVAEALRAFIRAVEAGTWSQAPRAMVGVPPLFDRAAKLADATLPHGDERWPIVADTFLVAGYEVWYTPHEPMSEHFFEEALAIQQRELKPDHPDIATTVGLLVGVLNKLGRSVEAERLIRGSLE
ncbi:MAG: serine/threonine protein kinase, partial [Phycisphaerales bacterium]|nr:serine/threonine protein kinase [Phycisphaerales bacterium]